MADRSQIILVGRAHDLTITGGIARWRIVTSDGAIKLRGDGPIAAQCRMVGAGQPIGVIAELPSFPPSATKVAESTTDRWTSATYEWRLDSPDVELAVTRLELLRDSRKADFWMQFSFRIFNTAFDACEVTAELDRFSASSAPGSSPSPAPCSPLDSRGEE